ncbi:MAG: S4 domain-containing protein, partial [Brevefilum sp.]
MNQKTRQFTVQSDKESRIDKFLSDQLPEISRSQIKGLIESGKVILDGEIVRKAGEKIKTGNMVEIMIPEEEVDGLIPEEIPLDIIFEDNQVIAVNKPAGMVVHPGAGNSSGTIVNALLAHYPPIR